MKWFVLAPGPSLTVELAEQVRGHKVCAVTLAFKLAPWADLLVATDRGWWMRHPEARQVMGRKFSANWIPDIELVKPSMYGTSSNSGVLALDLVKHVGATEIVLLGFDMHGTHFCGPYTNGCANTPDRRREEFQRQFAAWGKANRGVKVINCTKGSRLAAFPQGSLEDHLGGLHGEADGSGRDPAQAETAA